MALFYITISTELCVSYMAITQPSDHLAYNHDFNQESITRPVYNNTTDAIVLPIGDLIPHNHFSRSRFNFYTNMVFTNNTALPIYISTKASRVPFSITSVRPADSVFALGNKGAHIYHGNIEKTSAKRKPKYPCIACDRGVVATSKAVSCDVCQHWIHVKCTDTTSLDQYHKLVSSNEPILFTCNTCTLQTLPFPEGTSPDSSYDNISSPVINPRNPDIDYSWFQAKAFTL